MKETNAQILTNVVWSLSNLSDIEDSVIGIFISSGIVPPLIRHLR